MLWLVPAARPNRADAPPSAAELESWAGIPETRWAQLRWSRGWVRHCLAGRLGVSPQQVPLLAPPGQAPSLAAGWGHVSFSHCCDALAIAWSDQPIGVDLERLDRRFPAKALAQRFFCQDDQDALRGLVGEPLRQAVLRQWVAKEAAIKWDRSSLARDLAHWVCPAMALEARHRTRGIRVPLRQLESGPWCLGLVGPMAGQTAPICLA